MGNNPLKLIPDSAGPDMLSFFEMTPDLVCIADKDGYFRDVNPAVIEKLGYTKEELFAHPISTLIHPNDKELTKHKRALLLKGKILVNFRNRYLTKSGNIIWLEWTSIYIPDKEVVFAIAKDITQRKKAEVEVEEKYERYKNLTTHFKNVLETDRKYIAAELHEELAQMVSVIKLDIDWIMENEAELNDTSRERFKHAAAVCNLLVHAIRRISFSMSPHMIEDLGLTATLERYCKEFALLHDISCMVESRYEEAALPAYIKLDIFRICQDTLIYAAVQQRVNNIVVQLQHTRHSLHITIQFECLYTDAGHDKLDQIRQKTAALNGQAIVENSESEMLIQVTLPV
ncbi:MAG: PAS domain S-box protein [Chitinophagaceae bacterium]|nr:PAS domain S-box protein [Chitinophagaceae bacterium]